MSPLLSRLYALSPVPVQNLLLSTFSARLGKQRYGGRFGEFVALLDQSQWWEPNRMREWQAAQLRRVLVHAEEHVPYYRETFRRHGFVPAQVESIDDLRRLPVLTRDIVKHRVADLKSRGPGSPTLTEGHTSGTTGSPITLFYDSDMIAMNYAVMDRQYRWAGCRLERNWRSSRGGPGQRHRAPDAEAPAFLAIQPRSQPDSPVVLPPVATDIWMPICER